MKTLDCVLGWPLQEAQAYLSTLGLEATVTKTMPFKQPVNEQEGEYRVIAYRQETTSPCLIVSFFPFGVGTNPGL